ncbi:MAG: HEAT repeat domain-containing protein [Phototrophicaceae bacterium]|jgi:hypothetical protein
MSSDPAVLLKSLNPDDRKAAVKTIAQMQSDRALRVLVRIAKEDKDESVREFARKGAAYVQKHLQAQGVDVAAILAGNAAAPAPAPVLQIAELEEEEEPAPIVVSERDKRRATEYINSALGYGDNREKAMAALTKALQANPTLATDSYFSSVASSVTGLPNAEAVSALRDDSQRKGIVQAERQQKVQNIQQSHLNTARSHNLVSVAIDLGTLSLLLFLGTFLVMFAFGQSARARTPVLLEQIALAPVSYEEGSDELAEALDYFSARLAAFTVFPEVFSLLNAGLVAVGLWLGTVLALLAFCGVVHLVASRMMGGIGTYFYQLHQVCGAYTLPLLIIYLLIVVIMLVIFYLDLSLVIGGFIIGGIISLGSLVITFRVIGRVGKAYNFGFIQALISAFAGSFVYNPILGFILSLTATGVITTLITVFGDLS